MILGPSSPSVYHFSTISIPLQFNIFPLSPFIWTCRWAGCSLTYWGALHLKKTSFPHQNHSLRQKADAEDLSWCGKFGLSTNFNHCMQPLPFLLLHRFDALDCKLFYFSYATARGKNGQIKTCHWMRLFPCASQTPSVTRGDTLGYSSFGRVLCFRCQVRCNDLENGRSLPSNDFPIQNIGFSFSFTPSLLLPFLLHSSPRSSPPPDGLDKSLSFLLARCTWQDWQWSAELIRSPDFKMPLGRLERPSPVYGWMITDVNRILGLSTDFQPLTISFF